MMRKYKNYKGASITIRGSQIMTIVMFNLMIKKEITNCDNGNVQSDEKKVNGTVVLTPFYITK